MTRDEFEALKKRVEFWGPPSGEADEVGMSVTDWDAVVAYIDQLQKEAQTPAPPINWGQDGSGMPDPNFQP